MRLKPSSNVELFMRRIKSFVMFQVVSLTNYFATSLFDITKKCEAQRSAVSLPVYFGPRSFSYEYSRK